MVSCRFAFFLLLSAICWSCAQIGAPTGGPIDEDPPGVVGCDPPNYSVRFNARKIFITFDEYIVLDNVNQELIVSPPMEEKPEVKLRRKTLIIQFEETLKENTTYTFNFGSAIKDLHEGNKLQNYEYVFSTGEVLDSLSVRGNIHYARDLSPPDEPISIMLYSDLRDSVPLTDIPLYVGKSNDSGIFSVNNLKPDVYKVFALKDGNNNLLFDLPSEEIAFLDTSLIVNAEFARKILEAAGTPAPSDTAATVPDPEIIPEGVPPVVTDSAEAGIDSLEVQGPDLNAIYIDLLLFTERSEIQYITDYSREDRRKLQIVFALPLTDSFSYSSFAGRDGKPLAALEYLSPGRDSLILWALDSADYRLDSLSTVVRYTVLDTLQQPVTQTDTLLFSYRERTASRRRGGDREEEEDVDKLQVNTIRSGRVQELNRDLLLQGDFPVREVTDSLITLYHIPDSVEIPQSFEVEADSVRLDRWWIRTDWVPAAEYRIQILPGAIRSVYPLEHDTIDVKFKTRDVEYYGQILLNLENVRDRVLVQLTSKETVVRERIVHEPGQYTFPFLLPGAYGFTFIHDENGNGEWDTGKYLQKLQPEKVEKLPVNITVRSNWDHDVTMKLEK